MTYELAKELKDAGFHQGVERAVCPHKKLNHLCDEEAYVPTLEELIEACASGNLTLEQQHIGKELRWRAEDRYLSVVTYGSTPTEAIARLWLALNPKKN